MGGKFIKNKWNNMGMVNDIWVLSTKEGKRYKRKIEIEHELIILTSKTTQSRWSLRVHLMLWTIDSQPPLATSPNWCSREECIEKTFQNYKSMCY
jgi:hypothetical protein